MFSSIRGLSTSDIIRYLTCSISSPLRVVRSRVLCPAASRSSHSHSFQSSRKTIATMANEKQPVVCVFCGAFPGNSEVYLQAARSLAHTFAAHNIQLVYGGGTVGIMGELAKTLVSLRGPSSVHGIIPRSLLETERKYDASAPSRVDLYNASSFNINSLIDEREFGRTTVVEDMHTRKQMMKQAVVEGGPGSGFVALTGGYGTLEELMEMVTWNQLGIHAMPVVLYNVQGYWDGLLQWVRTAVETGFIGEKNRGIMAEAGSAEEVVERLRDYVNSEGRFNLVWEKKS